MKILEMQITEAFKGKTLVITGGTGSFGSTVLKHFLASEIGEIRIISRDEKKQDMLRHVLQARYPDLFFARPFWKKDVKFCLTFTAFFMDLTGALRRTNRFLLHRMYLNFLEI